MSTLKEKAEAILQEKEEKIIPENFSENLEVLGVQGELPEGDYYGGAFASSIEVRNGMVTFYGGTGEKQIVGAENIAVVGFSNDNVAEAINLTADKIKKDEVILGITGTYEGSGSSDIVRIKLFDNVSNYNGNFNNIKFIYNSSVDKLYIDFDYTATNYNPKDEYILLNIIGSEKPVDLDYDLGAQLVTQIDCDVNETKHIISELTYVYYHTTPEDIQYVTTNLDFIFNQVILLHSISSGV